MYFLAIVHLERQVMYPTSQYFWLLASAIGRSVYFKPATFLGFTMFKTGTNITLPSRDCKQQIMRLVRLWSKLYGLGS